MTAASAIGALADLREQADRCPRLWLAVLHCVLLDVTRPDADGAAARAWLRNADPWIAAVSTWIRTRSRGWQLPPSARHRPSHASGAFRGSS